MMASPIIAGGVALLVAIARPGALRSAAPFLLLWFAAPGVAYWLSLPVGLRQRPLSDAERVAPAADRQARPGGYFETFVTADDLMAAAGQLSGERHRAAAGPAHVADQRRR